MLWEHSISLFVTRCKKVALLIEWFEMRKNKKQRGYQTTTLAGAMANIHGLSTKTHIIYESNYYGVISRNQHN